MKIRQSHPILDRIKVIMLLLALLLCLGRLAEFLDEKKEMTEMKEVKKSASIEKFIRTALQPVGSTMYIWGGGWNEADQASGSAATQIGLSPQWESFAKEQDENYDYKEHQFERENGLDCSGYVGWVMYNTFETTDGQDGYVITSTEMAKDFSKRGFGEYIENPTKILAGDIVSMNGHVWISLGTCADGSVLLVHASPPGVSVCGTKLKEAEESVAVRLATEYMFQNHFAWQEKYPNRTVPDTYLKGVSVMRWNGGTMADAEVIQSLSGEELMELLQASAD